MYKIVTCIYIYLHIHIYTCIKGKGCVYAGSKSLVYRFCGPSAGIMALFYLLYRPTCGGKFGMFPVETRVIRCSHDFVIRRPGWPSLSSINTS